MLSSRFSFLYSLPGDFIKPKNFICLYICAHVYVTNKLEKKTNNIITAILVYFIIIFLFYYFFFVAEKKLRK